MPRQVANVTSPWPSYVSSVRMMKCLSTYTRRCHVIAQCLRGVAVSDAIQSFDIWPASRTDMFGRNSPSHHCESEKVSDWMGRTELVNHCAYFYTWLEKSAWKNKDSPTYTAYEIFSRNCRFWINFNYFNRLNADGLKLNNAWFPRTI